MIAKGAPWTRSSLSTFGNGAASYEAYSAAPSRPDPYSGPQQLRPPASNPYSNLPKPPESRAQPSGFSSGSILSFPSSQQRPGEAEQRRAQKQELFDFYQAAMREKAQRGKDDVASDPLKARAGELSLQYERERARVRKAIGASILSSDASANEGRRGGNSFSVPAQDSRSRGNPIEDIENLRRRKVQGEPTFSLKSSNSVKSYQENAALFYGEPPQAALTPAKLAPVLPQKGTSSLQENAAKFYGEASTESKYTPPRPAFDSIPQSRPSQPPQQRSFEENKAAFFGADGGDQRQFNRNTSVLNAGKPPSSVDLNKAVFLGDGQQQTFSTSPILGKTVPKSTISDPITGVVRTVSSQRTRFQPLGKEKPDVFVGKINDSPAPTADIYGSQPSFTKKSGNKPYSYNPLTGQDYEYGAGNPFRGSAAYMR